MLKKYFRWTKLWLVLVGSLFFISLSAQECLPENFHEWVESARGDWKIPGMAIGIVKDGQVIYATGFGETQLGNGELVNENTIFSIASVSKNITAAALGILVDRGVIDWDDKITDHIPWFRLKDPWITHELTIRDALTHKSGVGRILGNRLQYMTKSTRDEVLYQLRYMDLEKPFRSSYVYNNVMYSLTGQIIEYTDGRTWDEFLQDELFEPLGMTRASTSITALENQSNIAFPHQEIDQTVTPIPRRNWDNAGPAGGVNASVNDLNKWMIMQLGTPGDFGGRTIVSEKQMNEIQKQQTLRPVSDALASQATYGFGWSIFDYHGKRVLTHGGATDGFNTQMYLMPALNFGIIIVTNTFNSLSSAIAYQVMDACLGISEEDWNEIYLRYYNHRYESAFTAREEIHQSRINNTSPSLDPDDFIGVYFSEGYGQAEVKKQGGDLIIQFWKDEDTEAVLEHWHYNTYRAVWKNPAMREEFMQFQLDKQGEVEALEFEFILRPQLLQVGAYPSHYTHKERFMRQ